MEPGLSWRGPLYHAAWPLFLGKDLEKARVWLREARIEVFLGTLRGKTPLAVDIKHEEFTEILGDGTNVVVPRIIGKVKLPPGQRELSLWVGFSGMFHPRVLPRMFFFPEGFVTGRWKVEVNTAQSDLGCSVMPLVDRAQVEIKRLPRPASEQEGSIEILPHWGSLLLPTDGTLVSFFPAGSL